MEIVQLHTFFGSVIEAAPRTGVLARVVGRRFQIEVVGESKRVYSSFVKGYESLPVRIS